MSVETSHALYDKQYPSWARTRDAVTGQGAIIAGKDAYVPKPSGLDEQEFKAYISRGSWYGATRRTIDGMSGLIFRKDPHIEIPEGFDYLETLASNDGKSLRELADFVVEEILSTGRVGVLVDFPAIDLSQTRTLAQAEQEGDRPYLSTYVAESIVNWRWRTLKAYRILDRVILKETVSVPDPQDEFSLIDVDQYRELGLDDAGKYYQRLWKLGDDGKTWTADEPVYPTFRGAALMRLPFFCATPMGDFIDCPIVPLLDLVNLNIAHWKNSCDYEHGLHFTGNPMPVITGYSATEGETITVGSERCLTLTDPQAQAFYMEFTGTGLSSLKEAMKDKEARMAMVGSRLLTEDTKGVEAAETAAIHRAGENSVLGSIAAATSKVLTRAYALMIDWAGGNPDDVTIQLNMDFLPWSMDAQMVTALVAAQQTGLFSKQTLFQKFQEGEVIPQGIDYETDQERIEEEMMLALPMVVDTGQIDANQQ